MAMADETPRLGLPIYTSGTDLHPTREDFNDRMQLLEEAVAIARHGDSSERGLPATRGTLFMETDTRLLWFDTGDEWIRVLRIGHDGPGRALNIGGPGAEGESEWAARADHTHPLPLATASQPGAMSAADKADLDAASPQSDAGALVRRFSGGGFHVPTPGASNHPTPRSYVDQQVNTRARSSHTHNASDVNSGTLDSARLPAATTSQQGALSAADKTKLDNATSLNEPSTVMSRNANGHTNVADPAAMAHIANRRYVEQRITDHRHDASDTNTGTFAAARLPAATRSAQGAQSAAHFQMLDDAGNAQEGRNNLVRRNGYGQYSAMPPTHSAHVTPRSYVDDQVGSVFEGAPLGNVNLNSRTTPGQFYVGNSTNASEANNFPPGAEGYEGVLEVLRHISNSVMQRYTVAVSPHPMWIRRRYTGGSWSSWSRVGG